MSVLKPLHPRARILDGVLVPAGLDLAYNPGERRDSNGRWTDDGGFDTQSLADLLAPDDDSYSSPTKPTHAEAREDNDWAEVEKMGMDDSAMTKRSVKVQENAQIDAAWWANNEVSGDSPEDEQYAASLWQQYQSPTLYTAINGTLRSGKPVKVEGQTGPSAAKMMHYADVAFEKGGVKTKQDIVLYHAIKSQKDDWSQKLKPGDTFEDKGFISTTAYPRFATGWLALNPTDDGATGKQRPVTPKDVVMEIRVPKGTTILGGDTQFIETMLHPDSKFKIISSETRTAKDPSSPLGDYPDDPFTYTHIIAELQP